MTSRAAKQPAEVTLKQTDGSSRTVRVDFPKGEPENPLTETEFRKRYDAMMAYGQTDPAEADRIYAEAYRPGISVRELLGD